MPATQETSSLFSFTPENHNELVNRIKRREKQEMLFQNLLQDCQTLCHGTWKTIAATHFCLFQYFLHSVDADIGCYVTRIASVGCASAAIIIRRRLSCKLFSFSQQGLLEFHVAFCQTNNHAQFGKPREQYNAILVRELLFLDGRLKNFIYLFSIPLVPCRQTPSLSSVPSSYWN